MTETETLVEQKDKSRNRKASILCAAGFIVVVALMLIMRFFVFNKDIFYSISEGRTDGFFIPAYIGDNGLIYCNYLSDKGFYLTFLSCVFKFFGNVEDLIFFYDIALELLALIFIFFALKRVFGRIASFVFSLIIACYPGFILLSGYITGIYYVLIWRNDRIVYLTIAIALWLMSFVVGAIRSVVRNRKQDPVVFSNDDDVQTAPAEDDKKYDQDVFGSEVNVVLSDDGMLIEELEESGDVELLISPLPGPKKPQHKELDYDYEIDEDRMKYDIEVEDTAEFDHE